LDPEACFDESAGLGWLVTKGWVTMGGHTNEDGEHSGGTHVFIGAGGKIERGPAHMVGKKPSELGKKKPKSKILRKAIDECNRSIKKLVKKARTKNARTYHKLIHTEKKRTNEIDYFKKKLSNKEQLRVMRDLKEINQHMFVEKPYRLSLLDSKMPAKFKAMALQKLNVLRSMDPGDNEYYKIKNWVDTFMRIPFGIYKNLDVKMSDGVDVCHQFMEFLKHFI
jgi:ATP-dependent Lon protease